MARTDGLFEIRQTGYVSPIDGASLWLRGTDNYINFGLTPGASGYGFRDNAGVMEFKDAGGVWAAFGSGGGGTPAGSNGEWQYNNAGAFGGMAGITYENVNGALILDNALNANALFQTSTGTGVRKGIVFQIGASSNDIGADFLLYAGDGFTAGGNFTIESGNTTSGPAGTLFLRGGLSTTGDDGLVKIQSDKEIYLTDLLETKGLVVDTLNTDKVYVFPTLDGADGDFVKTNGSGLLSFQDSKAFFQYLGSLRGYDTEFTYDVNGNVDTKSFPAISVTLTFSYDVNGNVDNITDGTYTKTFTYDVNGNVTDIVYT